MRVKILLLFLIFNFKYSLSQKAPDINTVNLQGLMSLQPEQDVVKKAESVALQAAVFILSAPFDKTNPDVAKSSEFLIQWMSLAPGYKFDFNDKMAIKLVQDNEDLIVIYWASLIKYCLENKVTNATSNAAKMNATRLVLKYCENPKNKIGLTTRLNMLAEADKNGELDQFLVEEKAETSVAGTRITINKASAKYDVIVESLFCDFEKQIMCERESKIMIMRKGDSSPFQTITETIHVSASPDHLIRFEDLNFDSQEDLVLRDIANEYSIYLYDQDQKSFVLNVAFTDIVAECYSFTVSPTNKKVTVSYKPDYYWLTDKEYQVSENRPVLSNETILTFNIDPLQPVYYRITKELTDGQWKVTQNKITKQQTEDWLPGSSKLKEKTEIISVPYASEKFEVAIELPCVRARGKKNENSESYYTYTENKAATFIVKDKSTGTPFPTIKTKGISIFLNEEGRSSDGTFIWAYENQYWVKFQDLNFDDIEDLLIINGTWEDIKRYEVYLYAKNEDRFTYSPEVTALLQKWSDQNWSGNRFSFNADRDTKTLTLNFSTSDGYWESRSYHMIDGQPQLIKVTRTLRNGASTVIRELVKNAWFKTIMSVN